MGRTPPAGCHSATTRAQVPLPSLRYDGAYQCSATSPRQQHLSMYTICLLHNYHATQQPVKPVMRIDLLVSPEREMPVKRILENMSMLSLCTANINIYC